MRLVSLAIVLFLHYQAHGTGRTGDAAGYRFQIGTSHVRFLWSWRFPAVERETLPTLSLCGLEEPDRDTSGLLQQERSRWSLGFKGEGTVAIYSDHNRSRGAIFQFFCTSVERLTEFHDVNTVLTQSRSQLAETGLPASFNLQLDISVKLSLAI